MDEKQILIRTIETLTDPRVNRSSRTIKEDPVHAYIYLANLRFFLEIQNWLEARCTLTDLLAYNVTEERMRFHINSILGEYNELGLL